MAKARNSRRDRERPLRRSGPARDPNPRILVVCEGRVTEARYLEEFRRHEGNRLVEVVIDRRGGDPLRLVERAAEARDAAERDAARVEDDNLRYDEVWCAFDVDEHSRLGEARMRAEAESIALAISNPCVELWALLHFEEHSAHASGKEIARKLKKHVPAYAKELPFARLHPGYTVAVERARTLDRRHADADTPGGNPSTGFHLLTERIRQFGRRSRLATLPPS